VLATNYYQSSSSHEWILYDLDRAWLEMGMFWAYTSSHVVGVCYPLILSLTSRVFFAIHSPQQLRLAHETYGGISLNYNAYDMFH
jgi:hypothetical protein